jgi:2-oxoglutarate ferredoxin oxidoreductase subunit beta
VDHPFNPLALCKGADATFIARAMDRDPKQLREVLARADAHRGTSLMEIYQNCNVFNDGAFEVFTEKATKPFHTSSWNTANRSSSPTAPRASSLMA